MRAKQLLSAMGWAFTAILLLLFSVQSARAATSYAVLHRFEGKPGEFPISSLTLDADGNLYGTTVQGGRGSQCSLGCGTVFELERTSKGWSYKVLHEFESNDALPDGALPYAGVIFDSNGNLYGTTCCGGTAGYGTVFELTPTSGQQWKEKILYNFQGPEGAFPEAELIFDGQGNLYGTTTSWYDDQGGSVFKLAPGSNGQWTESTLISFPDPSGAIVPSGSLALDSAGNLYGATAFGGSPSGDGVVFELTPQQNGQWLETILYKFMGSSDGAVPNGGLVFDGEGNLYGTTGAGGNNKACDYSGCGTVFELTPGSVGWTEESLYVFCSVEKCRDGAVPATGVTFDAQGNLYGTTAEGGSSGFCYGLRGCGDVFELTPDTKGGWTEKVIHLFHPLSAGGGGPRAGVIFDSAGHLYGTTEYGGYDQLPCPIAENGCGVVFEIVP
jgi:uncharacterized repeat protein (TIGR03803 family)